MKALFILLAACGPAPATFTGIDDAAPLAEELSQAIGEDVTAGLTAWTVQVDMQPSLLDCGAVNTAQGCTTVNTEARIAWVRLSHFPGNAQYRGYFQHELLHVWLWVKTGDGDAHHCQDEWNKTTAAGLFLEHCSH